MPGSLRAPTSLFHKTQGTRQLGVVHVHCYSPASLQLTWTPVQEPAQAGAQKELRSMALPAQQQAEPQAPSFGTRRSQRSGRKRLRSDITSDDGEWEPIPAELLAVSPSTSLPEQQRSSSQPTADAAAPSARKQQRGAALIRSLPKKAAPHECPGMEVQVVRRGSRCCAYTSWHVHCANCTLRGKSKPDLRAKHERAWKSAGTGGREGSPTSTSCSWPQQGKLPTTRLPPTGKPSAEVRAGQQPQAAAATHAAPNPLLLQQHAVLSTLSARLARPSALSQPERDLVCHLLAATELTAGACSRLLCRMELRNAPYQDQAGQPRVAHGSGGGRVRGSGSSPIPSPAHSSATHSSIGSRRTQWVVPPSIPASPVSECPVCFEELKGAMHAFHMPCCGADVHVTCIQQVVQRQRTMRQVCPCCAAPLSPDTAQDVWHQVAVAKAASARQRTLALRALQA